MSYDIRVILCPVECASWRVVSGVGSAVVVLVLGSISWLFRGMDGTGLWGGVEGDDVSLLWIVVGARRHGWASVCQW